MYKKVFKKINKDFYEKLLQNHAKENIHNCNNYVNLFQSIKR